MIAMDVTPGTATRSAPAAPTCFDDGGRPPVWAPDRRRSDLRAARRRHAERTAAHRRSRRPSAARSGQARRSPACAVAVGVGVGLGVGEGAATTSFTVPSTTPSAEYLALPSTVPGGGAVRRLDGRVTLLTIFAALRTTRVNVVWATASSAVPSLKGTLRTIWPSVTTALRSYRVEAHSNSATWSPASTLRAGASSVAVTSHRSPGRPEPTRQNPAAGVLPHLIPSTQSRVRRRLLLSAATS